MAEAQLEGRMRLRPTAILCASEVLTPAIRRRVAEAFGSEPFDVYGATETATVACECAAHRGLHLFEDLVVSEVVDERDHPVPIGQPGARVLVTVLFARTLPLIRYAMSDAPILQAGACACGRPYALLAGVEGRADETLRLPGKAGGEVAVHPVVFYRVMEAATGHEWQVVREASGLRVDVALAAQVDAAAVTAGITAALERAGVAPVPIALRAVARVERGKSGKAARVRSEARPDHTRA
ncbi:MAG: hypothetical protein U1F43_38735 [Myxococcota bacterium]